eukprot:TRINITY_DN66226_c9_g3_i2.p1 TRINITY_DN66226_c9_g3~~TRINITY_DN66226_c9_g3_i2.p1  ORF type:complete len:115 (-),score=50.67 TRINITY_DN66226_c9_g3_i2:109-453(-)
MADDLWPDEATARRLFDRIVSEHSSGDGGSDGDVEEKAQAKPGVTRKVMREFFAERFVPVDDAQVEAAFAFADADQDGVVTFEDFFKACRSAAVSSSSSSSVSSSAASSAASKQ